MNVRTAKWLDLVLCVVATISFAAASTRAAEAAKEKDGKSPATTKASDQPGPLRFYGTISAVDASAKTFTVDNQTYSIVAETQMTKAADDKPATIADATVGETVRGSYTKSSDGKLNVTKVRFGKKTGGGGKAGGKKKNGATQPAAAVAPKE